MRSIFMDDTNTLDDLLRDLSFDDDSSLSLQSLLDDLCGDDATDAPSRFAEQWFVVVSCQDEEEQIALFDRLSTEGLLCKLLTS